MLSNFDFLGITSQLKVLNKVPRKYFLIFSYTIWYSDIHGNRGSGKMIAIVRFSKWSMNWHAGKENGLTGESESLRHSLKFRNHGSRWAVSARVLGEYVLLLVV